MKKSLLRKTITTFMIMALGACSDSSKDEPQVEVTINGIAYEEVPRRNLFDPRLPYSITIWEQCSAARCQHTLIPLNRDDPTYRFSFYLSLENNTLVIGQDYQIIPPPFSDIDFMNPYDMMEYTSTLSPGTGIAHCYKDFSFENQFILCGNIRIEDYDESRHLCYGSLSLLSEEESTDPIRMTGTFKVTKIGGQISRPSL